MFPYDMRVRLIRNSKLCTGVVANVRKSVHSPHRKAPQGGIRHVTFSRCGAAPASAPRGINMQMFLMRTHAGRGNAPSSSH